VEIYTSDKEPTFMSMDNFMENMMQNMANEMTNLRRIESENQRRQTEENFGYASVIFRSLMEQVREFERGLNYDEEIGALIALFGREVEIRIIKIDYTDPHLLIFHGIDIISNKPFRLIQHPTQTNLILKAVPKIDSNQEPRRIGY
jgi:hypothetical protein